MDEEWKEITEWQEDSKVDYKSGRFASADGHVSYESVNVGLEIEADTKSVAETYARYMIISTNGMLNFPYLTMITQNVINI